MTKSSGLSVAALLAALTMTAPAFAQSQDTPAATPDAASAQEAAIMLTTVPVGSVTVSRYYKQDIYDPSDDKIGEVKDVLIDADGKVSALMVSVGGFLGMDEKDVAIAFDGVRATQKGDDWRLTVDTTKDALKAAPGYKYDDKTGEWQPDNG